MYHREQHCCLHQCFISLLCVCVCVCVIRVFQTSLGGHFRLLCWWLSDLRPSHETFRTFWTFVVTAAPAESPKDFPVTPPPAPSQNSEHLLGNQSPPTLQHSAPLLDQTLPSPPIRMWIADMYVPSLPLLFLLAWPRTRLVQFVCFLPHHCPHLPSIWTLKGRGGEFASLPFVFELNRKNKWVKTFPHYITSFSLSACPDCLLAYFTPVSHTFPPSNVPPGNTAAKLPSSAYLSSFPPSLPFLHCLHLIILSAYPSSGLSLDSALCLSQPLPYPPTASYTLYSVCVYKGWRMFSQTEYQSISLWKDIILK